MVPYFRQPCGVVRSPWGPQAPARVPPCLLGVLPPLSTGLEGGLERAPAPSLCSCPGSRSPSKRILHSSPSCLEGVPIPMAPSSALSIFFFEDEEPRTPHLLKPTKRRVGAWQWSTQMLLDVTAALCSCCQLPRPQGPCHVGLCPWLLVAAAAVAGRGSQTPTDHSVSY